MTDRVVSKPQFIFNKIVGSENRRSLNLSFVCEFDGLVAPDNKLPRVSLNLSKLFPRVLLETISW